jgi:hypothetical protein
MIFIDFKVFEMFLELLESHPKYSIVCDSVKSNLLFYLAGPERRVITPVSNPFNFAPWIS